MDRIASENGCAGLVREHDSGAVNLHGASHLIARLAFEARYSGARQYIFESRSRLWDREYGARIWFALQATILSFHAADLAIRGVRAVRERTRAVLRS